ncbi:MAG: VWA domain-containing protein [Acidobacteriaceae bacterium]|nr:VWA domain-containing protein [Acidobacteriaceae bacterium]
MHHRLLLSLAALFVGLILPRQALPQSEYRLRAESTLVVIPVSVTDASNHFVLNLEKDRFSLFEDGVKQRISQFAAEDAPLSIGLLIDVSGSMGRKLEISRSAVAEFMKTMNPQDEAFLIEFSDKAQVEVGFTKDPNAITEKLNSVQSAGLTALLDAVHLGLSQMKLAKNPRKALLILSDGGDNNSQYTGDEIKQVVREADVQIYCMGVFEPVLFPGLSAAEVSGPALLAEIADQTGGRVFPARTLSALPSIARRVGVELRNEYILAYSPSNSTRDGKFRKVKVTLEAPDGLSGLKARWRSGYYAPTD